MCKHHKTDPTAFSVASSFTSLSQRPYTPLGHKQFNVSSSGIKNRAKRVISFQAANRRAQKLFLLTSPPKPANYGLTRIIQPNLSEQVFLSCPLRDVTHTRQLIVRVGTFIYSLGNQQFDPLTPQGRNIHLSSISKYRNSVIYKNPARDRMHIENVNAVAVRLHH